MKRSIVVFAVLMAVSSFTSAKISYVDGEVTGINAESKTISIVKDESGEAVTYKVDNKTSKKLHRVKEGDNVSLRLKSAKLEK